MKSKIETYTKIISSDKIKIEPFDVDKRYTKPHRHNKYLELVYFKKGSGFHYMDLKSYEIIPPVIFLINKDQVHHWEIDTIPDGFVIIIKDDFLHETFDKNITIQLQQLSLKQRINLKTDETINSLFQILCVEIKQKGTGYNEVIEGALKALLAKIINHAHIIEASSMGDVLSRFNQLLSKELKNDVSYYSGVLNTTPQNLNTLCKTEYSKTASHVIAEYIIKEAKRLLRFTDLSVTEIAYKFDFKDVSHFVKYFKRHEGKTPMRFKKRL